MALRIVLNFEVHMALHTVLNFELRVAWRLTLSFEMRMALRVALNSELRKSSNHYTSLPLHVLHSNESKSQKYGHKFLLNILCTW